MVVFYPLCYHANWSLFIAGSTDRITFDRFYIVIEILLKPDKGIPLNEGKREEEKQETSSPTPQDSNPVSLDPLAHVILLYYNHGPTKYDS